MLCSKQSQVINNLLSFSGGIITSSCSFISSCPSFFGLLPNEVIVSAFFSPIKSPVASALLVNTFLPAILPKLILSFFVASIIFYHIYYC